VEYQCCHAIIVVAASKLPKVLNVCEECIALVEHQNLSARLGHGSTTMRRHATCLTAFHRPSAAAVAVGLIAAATVLATPAWAQPPSPPNVGGLQPNVPVVPTAPGRAAEGTAAEQKFNLKPATPPTGSFLDSLKGNDAAIEVIIGQGRLVQLKKSLASKKGTPNIAVGDPTILDFDILPNPRMIRVTGLRAGVTDLSFTTGDDETYTFEVHVVYDLALLRAQLKQIFPDADLRLAQLREHIIVEGEARSMSQVARILETINAYAQSVVVANSVQSRGGGDNDGQGRGRGRGRPEEVPPPKQDGEGPQEDDSRPEAAGDAGGRPNTRATFNRPLIINLIRVPGVQQVLLKVRIAELNRTALREMGADGIKRLHHGLLGWKVSGASINALSTLGLGGLTGAADAGTATGTTAFGIFPHNDLALILKLLRQNGLVTILAEPNLIALNGHHANFLAGGEFPIPVPQGGNGAANTTTIQFREFGVRLDFLPFLVSEERIRLSVIPEVSNIDFALGTTLVAGGDPVPGLNTRRASTTVELGQGQTLAIAGLLHVEMGGETARIPGLGDVPYIGALFANNTHRRVEKELLVLVTPYLVEPMEKEQVGPLPGHNIAEPNDHEFYWMNRIEGRTGRPHRSTTDYEPFSRTKLMQYDKCHIRGPVGFSEP
jgi:pilus assembly protein CpaC